jgi:hypothetical protein
MKITYYKAGDGYIAVTKESPKGFKGILFIGKTGTLDKIVETAFEANQLRKLTKVTKADVPAEWVKALGYEEPDPAPPVEPPPVELDISWWPFTPPAGAKKMTLAEKRQSELIVLAMAVAAVVVAYLQI